MHRLTRQEGDRGAVAVIVAVLALALFGVGALAVDIGNMLSRKRMAQSSADFAALAGARDLPNAGTAIDTAFEYLATHGFVEEGTFTKVELTDTNLANGEIRVTSNNTKIVVDLPPRRVQFGLAAALGFSSGSVRAHAAATLVSPAPLLPFFLPVQCALGPQVLKEGSQSEGPVTEPTPVFAPSSTGTGQAPAVTSILPVTSPRGTTIGALSVSGTKFETTGMRVDFTRGTVRYEVAPTGPVPVANNGNGTLTVAVPTGVTDTAGVWYVRVTTSRGWSGDNDAETLTITDVAPVVTGCGQKETGDFGLLDSPRLDVNGNQARLDRNIALGLDHGVVRFEENPPTIVMPSDLLARNCQGLANDPIPGGVFDNDANLQAQQGNPPSPPPLPNCLDINNGNKVDAATDGLIRGGAGFTGRLTRPNSATACPGPGAGSNRRTMLGRDINNETIGCYIKSGYTIADLISANPPGDILKPEIFDSSRFFYIPVINSAFNPQNGFYPIREFRGVFITDESPGAPATGDNGLTSNNGGTKLTQIQVLAFKLDKLPAAAVGTGNGNVWVGGTKAVRLVE